MLDQVFARFLQKPRESDPLNLSTSLSPALSKQGRSVTRLSVRYSPPIATGETVHLKGHVSDEHLVRDVGELSLALALVALLAVVWLTPVTVRIAGIAWLVDGTLHLVYHLRHFDALPSDQRVASIARTGAGRTASAPANWL